MKKNLGLFILVSSLHVAAIIFLLKKDQRTTSRTGATTAPSANITIRVRCSLPEDAPNAIEASIWNPETMPKASPNCTHRGNLRSIECTWTQPRTEPAAYQVRYRLSRQVRPLDQQSNLASTYTTETQWGCTQVDNRTEFDQFGICEAWVDGTQHPSRTVDNGAMSQDGSSCNNSCNFVISGDFIQLPDRCVR